MSTTQEARDALTKELKRVDADNPVGAAKALGRVASRAQLSYDGEWASFGLSAEEALKPWLDGRSRVVAEGILAGCREQAVRRENGTAAPIPAEGFGNQAFPGPITAAELMDQPEPEVEWLAEGFLPEGGNVLVAGYPKTYKTTFVQDLAVSLASGSPFLDRFPIDRAHSVGLVLMEGLEWQAARRTRRLCMAHRLDPRTVGKRIHIWHRPPLVLNPTVVGALGEWVGRLGIDVLVLDNWSYVARGNSDDSDEVTPQLQAFSSIRDTVPGCTVVLLHHARKKKEGGGARLTDDIRNSGAFGAWYDAGVLLARKDEQSPVEVRCELRDYPSPDVFAFTVEDEHPASEANGWRSSGYLRITASDKSVAQLERDKRVEEVMPMVRDFVRDNPDCSKRALRQGVKARGADVDRAWKALVTAGEGEEEAPEGAFKAAKLRLCVPVSHGVLDTAEPTCVPVSHPRRGGLGTQAGQPNAEESHPVENALSTEGDA